ncbi:hypothetical protein Gogos_012627 [Gossypium gossypioides]|uniref:Uncharacterized protein n=1 Tax=Gossypium gossypioides TaxID=34282 RepID=A0A7J9BT35_GOSGO|nr:hypothetical protein [Gossypium gossypioides]
MLQNVASGQVYHATLLEASPKLTDLMRSLSRLEIDLGN